MKPLLLALVLLPLALLSQEEHKNVIQSLTTPASARRPDWLRSQTAGPHPPYTIAVSIDTCSLLRFNTTTWIPLPIIALSNSCIGSTTVTGFGFSSFEALWIFDVAVFGPGNPKIVLPDGTKTVELSDSIGDTNYCSSAYGPITALYNSYEVEAGWNPDTSKYEIGFEVVVDVYNDLGIEILSGEQTTFLENTLPIACNPISCAAICF